ncbi:hypothetical protein FNV43_RR27354 [Rhamnella rubrinervis]|uniref:Uncharacterized protein n=1 Tax=Rhamnella rubrinervis TaxID=2594499 RepID=A0A8K0DQW1_9ROSA|nr:hypothetical protein FNV43_RR27354 [Rhamnella rubrinervis]
MLLNYSMDNLYGLLMDHASREPLYDPKMVGNSIHSFGEVSDAESRYEPPKKGSKDDPIILSDSEEVDQEDKLEDNKRKWDAAFDAILDEEQQELEKENFDPFRYSSFDTKLQSTKTKLKGDPEDMDFEMNYARVNEKAYQDSDDDEDEVPKTAPHYHSDEFYEDSSSEE